MLKCYCWLPWAVKGSWIVKVLIGSGFRWFKGWFGHGGFIIFQEMMKAENLVIVKDW